MSASKDTQRGTWKVYVRYKDWQGENQIHTKRGFATKREALEYEREFQLKKTKDVNMGFSQFVEIYMEDISQRQWQKTEFKNPFYDLDRRAHL